jgi:DNA-binding transcriptional LysR family regulator
MRRSQPPNARNALRNTRRIRHAITLARHEHFGRAAIELNVSQSTLSRSIQALEQDLGLSLFTRAGHGTLPTPAGKLFLRKAADVLAAAEDLEIAMRRAWRASDKTVRFGMGPMPASLILPDLFRRQLQTPGGARLVCQVQTGMRLREMVEAEELDFAVCAEGAFELRGNLCAERLFDIATVIRVRNGHPLLARPMMTADDLVAYPFVGAYLDPRMVRELAPQSLLYDPVIASDDYRLMRDLVAASDAYCIFPARLSTPGLADLPAAQHLIAPAATMILLWQGDAKPDAAQALQPLFAEIAAA